MTEHSVEYSYRPATRNCVLDSRRHVILFAGLILAEVGLAQQPCVQGIHIDGVISDQTGAVIPGAHIKTSSGQSAVSDETGHYRLPCVPDAGTRITANAEGFAQATAALDAHVHNATHVNFRLSVAPVQTNVEVNANPSGVDSGDTAGSLVLGGEEVRRLADDPDDLLTELQSLAASGGGPPDSAVVSVNGFQRGSALPSKSSIASIRINPDPFSSERETAPWTGGRIEVTTKPGAKTYHGALFFIDSDHVFNATDPFSATSTPASNQRYGFQLGGPIHGQNTDFFASLEKRNIDEFNVVNAITLDGGYSPALLRQGVAAPQRLWIGSARGAWQVTQNDAASLSFSANVNDLVNQGVGGLVLPENGFNGLASEYDLRLLNTQILNARLMNETRLSFSWNRAEQMPQSSQPSLLVAGFFQGGGSTSGDLNNRERDLEADDDFILARGNHYLKAGLQVFGFFLHDYVPDTFNGAYVFGGGSAPALDGNNNPTGGTTTISAIDQYRRALLNLPGGTPTTFQISSGTPLVPLTQWRLALYIQDSIKLTARLTINAGLRYQLQTTPSSFANFAPRAGLAWAPDKKSNWVLHLNAGLFISPVVPAYEMQVHRLDGIRQSQSTIYAPNYTSPQSPATGSVRVNTLWQLPEAFAQFPAVMAQAGLEHEFPGHWRAQVDFDYGANWNQVREENINAPMVASTIGVAPNPVASVLAPRPLATNENIFRFEEAAHQRGKVIVATLRQNSYKRFSLSANYVRQIDMQSDGGFRNGDAAAANPQSTYSQEGEFSRTDWETPNIVSLLGDLKLPFKFELSPIVSARSGRPYNITTGTDANGDGDFNDRPSYTSTPGLGVFNTPFGLLTTDAVNGDVPRNLGTMPDTVQLDVNLNRAFTLNPRDKEHPRILTLNARSANLLNHTNVTSVDTILSSGALGRPVTAATARRIELGLRFAF